MTEAIVARKGPYAVTLEPGTYWWCACGRSRNQPYCDGSHQGTGLAPVKLELTETQKIWLCGCKRTKDRPFCDGSHNALS